MVLIVFCSYLLQLACSSLTLGARSCGNVKLIVSDSELARSLTHQLLMDCLEKIRLTAHFAKCCDEAGSPLDQEAMQDTQTKILSILTQHGEIELAEASQIIAFIGKSCLPSFLRQDVITSVKHRVNLTRELDEPTDARSNPDGMKNKNHYRIQHLLPQELWTMLRSASMNPLAVSYQFVKHVLNCDLKYVRVPL